jgi:hypothetical protein
MDVAIELKMTARQMERQSQKLEQQEKADRKKIVEVSPSQGRDGKRHDRLTYYFDRL